MGKKARLFFLGTGGGRFATIYQTRSTGGIYYRGNVNLNIDPGPSALHQMKKYNLRPTMTDAVLVSHCHLDHYNDAEVLIEGMTEGTTVVRGTLVASSSVLVGTGIIGPAISGYHQGLVEKVVTAIPGEHFDLKGIDISFTPSQHTDPTTVGFKLGNNWGTISYIADTDLTRSVIEAHEGSRLLIMASTRPLYAKIPNHLSTEDCAHIIGEIKPEMAILTHFGLKFIREGPELQADWISKKTGVETIAAFDGMQVELGDRPRVLEHSRGHRGQNRSARGRRSRGRSGPGPKRLNNEDRN